MAQLFDTGIFSVEGLAGEILPGALLNFYAVGTTTRKTTYSDNGLTTPNTNPVVANAAGRFPPIWTDGSNYKIVLTDFLGVVLLTREPVTGSGGGSGGSGATTSFAVYRAGTTVVSATQAIIDTAYHTYPGQGGARYVQNDTLVTVGYAAANPLTTFRTLDEAGTGHGYVLAEKQPDLTQFGAFYSTGVPSGTIQTANNAALTAAFGLAITGPAELNISGVVWLDPASPILLYKDSNTGGNIRMKGTGYQFAGLYWNTNDTHVVPLLGIPEGYVNGQNNKLYLRNGSVAGPGGPSVGTGRGLQWSGFTINGGLGKYVTLLNYCNFQNCNYTDMTFNIPYRGVFSSQSFDHTYINVRLEGRYYNNRTQTEVETNPELGFGIFADGQSVFSNISGRGLGCALVLNGTFNVAFTRFEQCEKGFHCGIPAPGLTFEWNAWDGTSAYGGGQLPRGVIESAQTESCFKGIEFRAAGQGTRMVQSSITGYAGAVPIAAPDYQVGRNPYYGIKVSADAGPNVSFDNVQSLASTVGGLVVNGGAPEIIGGNLTDYTLRPKGVNGILAKTDAGSHVSVRGTMMMVDPYAAQSTPADRKFQSFDTSTTLAGLTQVYNSKAPVQARSLGRRAVAVSSGVLFVDVTWPGQLSASSTDFATGPTAVTDGASTLTAATYFIAVTLVGDKGVLGETGVSWTDADYPSTTPVNIAAYKSVVVAAGKRIDMTFPGVGNPDLFKRRIYYGFTRGFFEGFFEIPATQTSFSITQSAPDGFAFPPNATGNTRSQQEVDTEYSVFASLPWDNGGWWITAKATTGFRINWKTAPGSATTIDYLLARLG